MLGAGWDGGGREFDTGLSLGMGTGTGRGSEEAASMGGSTDDNLIGSFTEEVGFGGGDVTEVTKVLSWQPVVSQLSSAQATPLSHLMCLRSSLYSLSTWALPAKRGKASRMKPRREQMVLRGGRRRLLVILVLLTSGHCVHLTSPVCHSPLAAAS